MRFLFETGRTPALIVCACVLLCGCGSTSASRFYTLTPVHSSAVDAGSPEADSSLVFGVGPVAIADYLDRPQIVLRSSHNELSLSEFNRWGGSLQSDTVRVLRENLENLLAGDGISVTSWRRGIPCRYRVSVDISRFESTAEANVVLKAQWAIFSGDGSKVLLVRDSTIREEVRGGEIGQVVAAMGSALGSLSREIAEGYRDVTAAVPGKPEDGSGQGVPAAAVR